MADLPRTDDTGGPFALAIEGPLRAVLEEGTARVQAATGKRADTTTWRRSSGAIGIIIAGGEMLRVCLLAPIPIIEANLVGGAWRAPVARPKTEAEAVEAATRLARDGVEQLLAVLAANEARAKVEH